MTDNQDSLTGRLRAPHESSNLHSSLCRVWGALGPELTMYNSYDTIGVVTANDIHRPSNQKYQIRQVHSPEHERLHKQSISHTVATFWQCWCRRQSAVAHAVPIRTGVASFPPNPSSPNPYHSSGIPYFRPPIAAPPRGTPPVGAYIVQK